MLACPELVDQTIRTYLHLVRIAKLRPMRVDDGFSYKIERHILHLKVHEIIAIISWNL